MYVCMYALHVLNVCVYMCHNGLHGLCMHVLFVCVHVCVHVMYACVNDSVYVVFLHICVDVFDVR